MMTAVCISTTVIVMYIYETTRRVCMQRAGTTRRPYVSRWNQYVVFVDTYRGTQGMNGDTLH
jgi:hypothetical protein